MVNWLNPLVHWDRLIGNVKSSGSFAFMMYGVYSSFWPGSTNWHPEQEEPGIAALNLQLTIWPSRTLARLDLFLFFFLCPCSINMPVWMHLADMCWIEDERVRLNSPAALQLRASSGHVIYRTMSTKWKITWFITFFLPEYLSVCVCVCVWVCLFLEFKSLAAAIFTQKYLSRWKWHETEHIWWKQAG